MIMNVLKNFLISIVFMSGIFKSSFSQIIDISKGDYIIYSAKEGKIVEPSAIIDDFANYNVMFYGEQHNDVITHNVQYMLLQMIYEKYGDKTALSMEMLDRDVQYILDEYLEGFIKESYFQKDSRCWPNYKDYRPMVEFAKSHKFKVIAANAPFRYVNLVNKFGLDTLMLLSEQAKKAMAPLPYGLADGDYAEKLRNLGKDDSSKKKSKTKTMPMPDSTKTKKYDIIPGHSLWDATMAYSVFQFYKSNPDSKILHLNGSFHTEEHFGIVQRLKEFDSTIKPLVVTSVSSGKKLSDIDFEKYKKDGDYIVFTKTKPE
ncbi:MAG: hypothetical protein A2033_04575 [Bacteroidetes bacterium GWA2_31_9]|nr:MAG: hypothetical protein A2033_04575 [Bacteroidetes bacterium GWA2_31_9]